MVVTSIASITGLGLVMDLGGASVVLASTPYPDSQTTFSLPPAFSLSFFFYLPVRSTETVIDTAILIHIKYTAITNLGGHTRTRTPQSRGSYVPLPLTLNTWNDEKDRRFTPRR